MTIRITAAQLARTTSLALLAVFAVVPVVEAIDPIHSNRQGLAIQGYDPVAYFAQQRALPGDERWSYEWNGATWRFASQSHLETFVEDPERYAPQYGGYCAYAVSKGSTAKIDPEAWAVVEGKLYLNYNSKIQKKWNADIPGYIARADQNWPRLLNE